MNSGSSIPKARVVLVAAFATLHDADAAARFLTDRGVPAETVGLRSRTQGSDGGRRRWRSRPLVYGALGGATTGLVGSLLWNAVAPEVLTVGWAVAAAVLVGLSAGGSIGALAEDGLNLPFGQSSESLPSTGEDRAVVAVGASQVPYATELLRRIGVERILVADDRHC